MRIVREALTELKVHAAIEEELFYPAVRKPVGKEIMNEADEEHHVAKLLIAELDRMDGSESHFDAKFRVLAENVRHHIKEEEGEMLPKARKVKVDFDALAEKMRRTQGAAAGGRGSPGRRGADGEGVPRPGRLAGPGREAKAAQASVQEVAVVDEGRDRPTRDRDPAREADSDALASGDRRATG